MGCADSKTAGGSGATIVVEYFGLGYARGDPIRFLLFHANASHQFVGYDFEQWGAMKAQGKSGEFDCLPRVTING